MLPEQMAVGFRVAQNSNVSGRAKLVSLSFKSMCIAIRLKCMIDIQPFRDLCSHARFVILAASSSTSSTVNSILVLVSISIVSDTRWLLVLI
jgi:hypothetical protein